MCISNVHVCVCIHSSLCSGQRSMLGVLPYLSRTIHFIPVTGSLIEPGARLAARKPQRSSHLCQLLLSQQRSGGSDGEGVYTQERAQDYLFTLLSCMGTRDELRSSRTACTVYPQGHGPQALHRF